MTRKEELEFIKEDVEDFYKYWKSEADFYDYIESAGWQDWMSNYCDDEDNLTESEIEAIEDIQKEGFEMYWQEQEEQEQLYYENCHNKLNGIKKWWNENVKEEYKITESEETFKEYFIDDVANDLLIEIPSHKTKSGHPEIFRY